MTVSTITVTVSMPSNQMLATDACLSCDPFGAAFCDCELLAALAAAVADAFVEDAAAFCAPGTRQEDKGRGGRGPWLVGTSENILHRRTHSAVYGCVVLHVCTVAARVLPAARVHHENIPGKCFTMPARVHCVGTRPRTSTRAGREQRVRAGVYVVCLTAL